jgi:hypothetical protein
MTQARAKFFRRWAESRFPAAIWFIAQSPLMGQGAVIRILPSRLQMAATGSSSSIVTPGANLSKYCANSGPAD